MKALGMTRKSSIDSKGVDPILTMSQLKSWMRMLPKTLEFSPSAVLAILEMVPDNSKQEERRYLDREMHDLTAKEFGAIMSRSSITVVGWCASGIIPGAYKLRGRAWRVPRDSVRLFKEQQLSPKSDVGDIDYVLSARNLSAIWR